MADTLTDKVCRTCTYWDRADNGRYSCEMPETVHHCMVERGHYGYDPYQGGVMPPQTEPDFGCTLWEKYTNA